MAGFKPLGLTFNDGDWNKLRIIVQHLGAQELPSLAVEPTGVLSRNTDVTSSDYGEVVLNYNTDQFDILSDELHIMHFHTPDTNSTVVGVDTEDNAGNNCTFVGYQAGKVGGIPAGGDYNTYLGASCGVGTLTGAIEGSVANTAVGAFSMNAIGGSSRNTAIGYYSLANLSAGYSVFGNTGHENCVIGSFAGGFMIGGFRNMAVGAASLQQGKFPMENVAIGTSALFYLSASYKAITAFADGGAGEVTVTSAGHGLLDGQEVKICNTTNYNITANISNIQPNTFDVTTSWLGDDETGYWFVTDEGRGNIAIGEQAGFSATTATYNTLLGQHAGYALTTGSKNVVFGTLAGDSLTTGSSNVFVGYGAGGQETTGSNKLFIHNSDSATPLIGGDFSTGLLTINNNLTAVGTITAEQLTSTDDITMQGHLFTLGNNTANDIVLSFDGDANDGLLTFDESEGLFDFGSSGLTTSGILTTSSVTLTGGGLDWKTVYRGNFLGLQPQTAGQSTFELWQGDSSEIITFNMWSGGTPASIANTRLTQIVDFIDRVEFRTLGVSGGTSLPLIISTNFNANQVYLATSGGVGIGQVPTGNYFQVDKTSYFYSLSTFVSRTYFNEDVRIAQDKTLIFGGDEVTGLILMYDTYDSLGQIDCSNFLRVVCIARFGNNGAGANYSQFAVDGELTLAGTARVWKSMDLTPSTIGKPSTDPPGSTYYQDVPFDAYDDTSEEQCFFVWHVRPDMAIGTASIKGHFDGMVATGPTGQDEYVAMGFEYTKFSPGDAFNISTPDGGGAVNITLTDGEGNYICHESQTGVVNTTGWAVDDIIVFRFFRDVDGTYTGGVDEAEDDDYSGDVLIGSYHLEFLSDKLGKAS